MKFGVNVPNFGPAAGPASLRRWTLEAEETGYHIAMVSDHVTLTDDVAGEYPAPFYDCFTTLAWMAALTSRIELGSTVVILPYRHPLQTARMAAGIDRFCDGRFVLGVGSGWAEQEFQAVGASFDQRGAVTDEYLQAIKQLWTGDLVSFAGRHVSFDRIHTGPRPVRDPHPPIWVGGASPAAIRRAGRYGDAWHPIRKSPQWLRETGLPRLRAAADAAGRPVPALCPRIQLRLTAGPLDQAGRGPGEGSLDQIRADLAGYAELGAEYVIFDTYFGVDRPRSDDEDWQLLRLLADQVLDLKAQTLR
jgi:probable F420-dependent oxidoreductase